MLAAVAIQSQLSIPPISYQPGRENPGTQSKSQQMTALHTRDCGLVSYNPLQQQSNCPCMSEIRVTTTKCKCYYTQLSCPLPFSAYTHLYTTESQVQTQLTNSLPFAMARPTGHLYFSQPTSQQHSRVCLPQYIRVGESVHELYLAQHLFARFAAFVHLEHHHLACAPMLHLQCIVS